jgi:hypothetical protein
MAVLLRIFNPYLVALLLYNAQIGADIFGIRGFILPFAVNGEEHARENGLFALILLPIIISILVLGSFEFAKRKSIQASNSIILFGIAACLNCALVFYMGTKKQADPTFIAGAAVLVGVYTGIGIGVIALARKIKITSKSK